MLADHLGASKLLVASPSAFPDDKDALLAEGLADYTVHIYWLDGHDLLDPNIVLRPLSQLTVTGERASKPEGWENDYLDWVRRSVTNQPE